MRRCLLLVVLLLAGCDNLIGPFRRTKTRVDDPRLSIPEQEKLGRQNLALPEEHNLGGQHLGVVRP